MRNIGIILGPHETEKSVRLAAVDQYTFWVDPDATKSAVAAAFQRRYSVKPTGVTIMTTKPKFRGQTGRRKRAPAKKAIVTLKKGTKIDLSTFPSA